MSSPSIAIIIYSMYGHIAIMAESVKKGIEEAGGTAEIWQIPETLPQEVLTKMHAPPKPDYPIIDAAKLATFDAFIMGIPTRIRQLPRTMEGAFRSSSLCLTVLINIETNQVFWDSTGSLWQTGALVGKYAGAFVSSAGPGGGQEMTINSALSTLTHHGIVGGSPWGAGTFAGKMGERQPSALELQMAVIQGKQFYGVVSRVKF
ncbi:flavoprotein-like protein [Roridomyces roridus]|uniref:Flavoprotein-like protein n=1 Tax=Roridomyces roridus TaxID=1738132 RepID=A0AAD7FEP1_9AGAR|nr:flavoprotein-like protein [Roridomyces roridus]